MSVKQYNAQPLQLNSANQLGNMVDGIRSERRTPDDITLYAAYEETLPYEGEDGRREYAYIPVGSTYFFGQNFGSIEVETPYEHIVVNWADESDSNDTEHCIRCDYKDIWGSVYGYGLIKQKGIWEWGLLEAQEAIRPTSSLTTTELHENRLARISSAVNIALWALDGAQVVPS